MMLMYLLAAFAGLSCQMICQAYFIRDWRVYVGEFVFAGGVLGCGIESLKFAVGLLK
jgi:hypothetical protein